MFLRAQIFLGRAVAVGWLTSAEATSDLFMARSELSPGVRRQTRLS
jgi:hypothetical protein